MFHVKKRTLLLIAGIVWLIAGFNVARLGVLSYRVIESKWYIYIYIYINDHCVLYIWNDVFQNEQKTHKTNYGI